MTGSRNSDFEEMRDDPFKEQLSGGWIAMIQHYFLSAWIPNPDQAHSYSTRVTNSGFNIAGFVSPATIVDPGQQGSKPLASTRDPRTSTAWRRSLPTLS
jgi:YidC/Oxa1 family membrane protein insertase